MKKIVKIITFIIVLNCILFYIAYTLLPKHNGYNAIDYFKNNHQLDIIWLGPSTTFYSISPMNIWDKYKITSYNYARTSQRIITFYSLKDIEKYNPKLIFFDITTLLSNNFLRSHLDNIYIWHLSLISRLHYLKKYDQELKYIFYIFLLKNFHDRWKYIHEQDFINNNRLYYMYGLNPQFTINKQKSMLNTNKYNFSNETIKIIKEIAQYIKKYDLNVVFWSPPIFLQDRYERSFLFENIIDEYDIPYINFNKILDKININYNQDLRDQVHINMYGGYKISDYLIKYAMKNYNIKSHENDPAYNSWNEDYKKYARAINREEIRELKSFADWKKQAFYDNYTVMLSANGDVLKKIPDTLKNNLKSFGLTKYNTDKPNMRYTAIIDDNKVFFEEVSNKPVTYKGRMKNIVNLLIKSDGKSTINVSGKPRSKNKYGLNFVIYDKINREIVDSIWIDPNKPDIIRR